ncbi:MAG: M28 family peptidase [Pelolinea sp.]|nr:M28 family peptidase [Pelolinea sp.]
MEQDSLIQTTRLYLNTLCRTIPTRRLGTQGNRDATTFFKERIDKFGFHTEAQPFDCIDIRQGEIQLMVDNQSFEVFISPFTLGCDVSAELVSAGSLLELENLKAKGKILLLHGEIAKEQLMPKGFVFYNPEEHQYVYRLLEEKKPAAIITATSKNPEAVGAIYPFPMIEDGDFDIPTAYIKETEGEKLLADTGKEVSLKMESERIPSNGENITAQKGGVKKKIVLCAHIDTKERTPGALDNASGVIILLLLAELLADYYGELGVELVALNGEEYYNTPGQVEYLKRYNGDFNSIVMAINMDDIGYFKGRTSYSFYGVPDKITKKVREVYADKKDFFEGPPWYQSDHGIFMANGVPAMAITEESVVELMAEITHREGHTRDHRPENAGRERKSARGDH